MKKTFPLHMPGKADARVIDSIKHEVRKYVQRERRKELPEGFGAWEFACKAGPTQAAAETKPLKEIGAAIDAVAQTGATHVYLEILAAPTNRAPETEST